MRKVSLILFKVYKRYISIYLKQIFGGGCLYYPSCSEYSYQAIKNNGFIKGGFLSFKRLLRCTVFSKSYFYDPSP
ncbi:hypothetical protein A2Z22_02940 [Candidatus Woesebacteria bacterium RBG_16_34_12]|uniref:Membrane protein insertion efficiency factor n=1 Tax=Candidatus Woesebacteria bacterium RBG_16_34_12 TaxID=1802480 RepID=A0A1F7X6W6_9BACT|nr:MAG: hypothetical protein A2Z22_02940 [Candidatus Woesebacteria bacterium RBG_16_34_12]